VCFPSCVASQHPTECAGLWGLAEIRTLPVIALPSLPRPRSIQFSSHRSLRCELKLAHPSARTEDKAKWKGGRGGGGGLRGRRVAFSSPASFAKTRKDEARRGYAHVNQSLHVSFRAFSLARLSASRSGLSVGSSLRQQGHVLCFSSHDSMQPLQNKWRQGIRRTAAPVS